MKIGILTYQYAMNYGAVLQAYALKTYLAHLGNDVEILNYDTSYIYQMNRSLKSKLVSGVWNICRSALGAKQKRRNFDRFRSQYLELGQDSIESETQLAVYAAKKDFDAFIVGSDQVWNPEINGGDEAYYLHFAENKRKISYAASFGVSRLKQADLKPIIENVKSFSAVSVREQTGVQLLESLPMPVQVVLDPVFLPEIEVWDKLAGKRIIDENYVLCYVLPGDREVEKQLEQMAKQYGERLGYKIIFVGRREYKRLKTDGTDWVAASPQEFVNLFQNAEFIVTNSFHGTAFSLIYEKQFYSIVNKRLGAEKQLSSRIVDLLDELHLPERIVGCGERYESKRMIDYGQVRETLDQLRKKSRDFLDHALREE